MRFPLVLCMAASLVGDGAAQALPPAVDVFVSGRDGYHTFRIPAVVMAADGALLAFAEARKRGRGDSGDIDLVCRRSEDRGQTWGDLQLVADAGDGVIGNPVPIVDAATGAVVLVATMQPADCDEADIRAGRKGWRKPCVLRSDDHGRTWSKPELLPAPEPEGAQWRWYATGPGHGVQLRSGPHAGRMVVPANHSLPGGGGDEFLGAHLLLSDDAGRTWCVGAVDDSHVGAGELNLNESTAAQYHDELVVLARDQNGRSPATRARARSLDGGATFAAPFAPTVTLQGPVCQGSLWSMGVRDGAWHLLFSAPREPTARRDLRVSVSADGGVGWSTTIQLYAGAAAYSDLVALDASRFGCLFEADDYARIVFQPFEVARERPFIFSPYIEPEVEPDLTRGFVAPPPEGKQHRVVDLAALQRCFSLAHLQRRGSEGEGRILNSPADLAMLEGVRDAVGRDQLGRAVPVDLFLWAAGAPEQPWLTKLGGVPHRERAAPWPMRADGKPMTFLAQWCFADSKDLLDVELPGEVLLMFVAGEWPWFEREEGKRVIHLEWSARVLQEPLARADLPAQGVAVPELHGVRHRALQYPDACRGDRTPFEVRGYKSRTYLLAEAQATLIGPSAFMIQGDWSRSGERLLCTLSSVQPNLVWPLLDRRGDARADKSTSPYELMLYDCGCYYVWIDRRGKVRVEFAC
jgi:sialidase-1